MRFTISTAAILLGACVGQPSVEAVSPAAVTVSVSDLALDTVEGRTVLRHRVATAAHHLCDLHGAEVIPAESRADPWYCPDWMRSEIVGEMTPDVRRAYALARREAGVRGRNL